MVLEQANQLRLDRCPHCGVARPLATSVAQCITQNHRGSGHRAWVVYACATCGGCVLTAAPHNPYVVGYISEMYPERASAHEAIPERARKYLDQAIETVSSPSASIMVAASSVDAMLKAKGYKQGSLYSRIDKAAADHLITKEMAEWAHEVRLGANDERHADEAAPTPDEEDARRLVSFAMALGEFLFVLPDRVARGRGKQGATGTAPQPPAPPRTSSPASPPSP